MIAAASRRGYGAGATMIATLALGSGPVIATLIPATTETIVALRFLLAAPVFYLLVRIAEDGLRWGDLRTCLPGGILLPLQVGLFFAAARMTSVADATFIMAVQPLLMVLLAPRLLGETVTPRSAVFAAVGIAGVGLVIYGSVDSGTARWGGELLAVANVIVWTAYLIVTKRVRSQREALSALKYQAGVNIIGAVVAAAVIVLFGLPIFALSAEAALDIGFLTVITAVLGHGLITWAQRYLAQTVISMILLAQPVAAMLFAALLLHQPITMAAITGAVVVVTAATLVTISPTANKGATV